MVVFCVFFFIKVRNIFIIVHSLTISYILLHITINS